MFNYYIPKYVPSYCPLFPIHASSQSLHLLYDGHESEAVRLLARLTSSMYLMKGVITCQHRSSVSGTSLISCNYMCALVCKAILTVQSAEVQDCVFSPRWQHIHSSLTLVFVCDL